MPLDLVVVNYHTPHDLDRFLSSLEAHPPSDPATLTIVEVDSEPYLHDFTWGPGYAGATVGVEGNIGYARACNLGARMGTHDVLALFNADVEITAGSLDACLTVFTEWPQAGVVGPRQVDRSGRIRHAGIFGSMQQPKMRGWNQRSAGQYLDTAEAVTVSGSAYFVRRAVWEELTECPLYRDVAPDATGAFLPTRHYYEETFCSYHAHAHGHQVVYFGGTTMIHQWHQASPVGGWAEQQIDTSRKYFREACDHHGLPHD